MGARLFREIWYFDSISGWHKLDTQALCGCDEVGWDPHARVVRHPADCGTCAKKKCAEGRWGHSMVIPPAGRAGRNNQVAHALFIGGWGEDGRTVRSVLRLNFEKQINTSEATNYSHADGLCESANGGCTDRCTGFSNQLAHRHRLLHRHGCGKRRARVGESRQTHARHRVR